MDHDRKHEVVIIGGGPAGLSAALLLGRCLRDVVVCDAGHPRNESSNAMHAFLGCDGVPPLEFLDRARDQILAYESVSFHQATVETVWRDGTGFSVGCNDGRRFNGKSVLLATGLVDQLPAIPGARRFYGKSLHHCPYCDGWEHRGQRIGVIGADSPAIELALELVIWSRKVTLYTHGEDIECERSIAKLAGCGIHVKRARILSLEGQGSYMKKVVLEDAPPSRCDALFFSPAQYQHDSLAKRMGFSILGANGEVETLTDGSTAIQGLFAAGNATRGIQMAMIAAAEGLKAGAAINCWLTDAEQSYLANPEGARHEAAGISVR